MDFEGLKEFFLNPNFGDYKVYLYFRKFVANSVRKIMPGLNEYDIEDLVSDML